MDFFFALNLDFVNKMIENRILTLNGCKAILLVEFKILALDLTTEFNHPGTHFDTTGHMCSRV